MMRASVVCYSYPMGGHVDREKSQIRVDEANEGEGGGPSALTTPSWWS
jgi:hypothetical protein